MRKKCEKKPGKPGFFFGKKRAPKFFSRKKTGKTRKKKMVCVAIFVQKSTQEFFNAEVAS